VPSVQFTPALQRHVDAPPEAVTGSTAREALVDYFARHPDVRGYIVDERGVLRRHVSVFVNGAQINDRATQSDPVEEHDELYVMQALSGG
jgi:sulfur-carrier protein